MIVVKIDDAIYARRIDQTDLKLLCVCYFVLQERVSLIRIFLLKLEATKFLR